MNRLSFRMSVIATMAALSALVFSTAGAGTAVAQPFGSNGVIYACFKANGKNKGTLRVVARQNGCKKLRGWRPVSWSANGSSGSTGTPGASGMTGTKGSPGATGPQGEPGAPGVEGKVEQSLIETIETQTSQIKVLTDQVTGLNGLVTGLEGNVTDLTDELGDLEGTVDDTCAQLTVLTKRSDDTLTKIAGIGLNSFLTGLGGLLEIPTLPAALGAFECS